MKTVKSNKGFTLIELLIAMAVASLLMAGVYKIFSSQINLSITQEQISSVQQNLRSAMYLLEKEIRMSGYGGTFTGGSATGFTAATVDGMTFQYLTNSLDPTQTQSTITYSLADGDGDGDNDLMRSVVGGGAATSVADNIEQIEFFYTYTDVAGATQQDTDPPTPADVGRIQSVQVSILARSSKSIPGSQTGKQYPTNPSGTVWGNTATVGTDTITENYNDGVYRRYSTSTILCRNL